VQPVGSYEVCFAVAGLALSADPNYKLLAKAYPYMAQRLLTDPTPELRETFEELMLQDGQFRWRRLINLMQVAALRSTQLFACLQKRSLRWRVSSNARCLRERESAFVSIARS
jgi:predicted unusual protein kinase regulating ubiquinone biosynthesis (AarF/ABC1/UbiB family)